MKSKQTLEFFPTDASYNDTYFQKFNYSPEIQYAQYGNISDFFTLGHKFLAKSLE